MARFEKYLRQLDSAQRSRAREEVRSHEDPGSEEECGRQRASDLASPCVDVTWRGQLRCEPARRAGWSSAIGDRLTIAVKYDNREHTGSLEWDPPPAVEAVEAVLRAHLGIEIGMLGDLKVGGTI